MSKLKESDKDLKLFLDVVKTFTNEIHLERIKLVKIGYSTEYIIKSIHYHRITINKLINRLQKRLNIPSITKFTISKIL